MNPADRSPGAGTSVAILIDQHLLDSFLTFAALRPQRAYAIHVRRDTALAERLRDIAKHRLGLDVALLPLRDGFDVRAISNIVRGLPAGTIVDVTGGTGILAPAAAAAMREDGRADSQVVAMDDWRRELVSFDGQHAALQELIDPEAVTVETALELAGLALAPRTDLAPPGFQAERDIRAIARYALFDQGPRLSHQHTVDWDAASLILDRSRTRGLRAIPDPKRRWARLLQGTWLEGFTLAAVCAAGGLSDDPGLAAQMLTCTYLATKMEFDVVAVARFRPHLLSCITSTTRAYLAHHLFEVEHRADVLGGPAVRPALVTLADRKSGRLPSQIEATVALHPPQLGMARVFGADDLRDWYRGLYKDDPSGLTGLAAWLSEDLPRPALSSQRAMP